MVKICSVFRDRLDGKITLETANHILEAEMFALEFSNGYYHHVAGREMIGP